MHIGNYKFGRYHAIIEKTWENNSRTYETEFKSEADLMESVYAIKSCIGKVCGVATDNPMILSDMKVYRGKEAIDKLKLIEERNSDNEKP